MDMLVLKESDTTVHINPENEKNHPSNSNFLKKTQCLNTNSREVSGNCSRPPTCPAPGRRDALPARLGPSLSVPAVERGEKLRLGLPSTG